MGMTSILVYVSPSDWTLELSKTRVQDSALKKLSRVSSFGSNLPSPMVGLLESLLDVLFCMLLRS